MERSGKRIALIQARIGSSRLPGKVLYPLVNDVPSLWLMVERVKRANIDEIVIATSTSQRDDVIVDYEHLPPGCSYFRGSEDDVFNRCYNAADEFVEDIYNDIIVNLTGDCPLCDPYIINEVIATFDNLDGAEYVSNINPPTFPDGLDVEVCSFSAYHRMYHAPLTDLDREHVTLYIRKHMDDFKTANVRCHENLSQMGWALDQQEDYEFIRAVYENLYPVNPHFGMEDILRLMKEKPEIAKINAHLRRNVWFDEVLEKGETNKRILEL